MRGDARGIPGFGFALAYQSLDSPSRNRQFDPGSHNRARCQQDVRIPLQRDKSMNHLPRSDFSTARLQPSSRLSAWRESIGTLFDVSPVAPGGAGFRARLTSYLLGEQVMLARCESAAPRFERAPLPVSSDGLHNYLL